MSEIPSKTVHTDEVYEIISAVPSWILRWGITIFFFLFCMLFGLAALIHYPDMIKVPLKINSPNSPKMIVAKVQGKLTRLLVQNEQAVMAYQPLAYIESTANHDQVLGLLTELKKIHSILSTSKSDSNFSFTLPSNLQMGETQMSYEAFYQSYLTYKAILSGGFYIKKRNFLKKDLVNINDQKNQLGSQKILQQRDFSLAVDEYEMHKKLFLQKVESPMELKQNESKYLLRKSPLIQTESALISSDNSYLAKQKEILELDNNMTEGKLKFIQALNSLISDIESWKTKYVLIAPQSGKVSYAGVIQENQMLATNQEVFYINPGNDDFFGEIDIPQDGMGKIRVNQEVLVKLHSFPYEEYGMLKGRIKYIAQVPLKDSIFVSYVTFDIKKNSDLKKNVYLRTGMKADAEIITQDVTVMTRIIRSIVKGMR